MSVLQIMYFWRKYRYLCYNKWLDGSSWSNITTLAVSDTFQCATYNLNDLKYHVGTKGRRLFVIFVFYIEFIYWIDFKSIIYAIYASSYTQQLQTFFIVGASNKTTSVLSVLNKNNTSSSFPNAQVTSSQLSQGFCIAYSLNGNIIEVGGTSNTASLGSGYVMAYSTDQGKAFTNTLTTNRRQILYWRTSLLYK